MKNIQKIKNLQLFRAKQELIIRILKLINDYKSIEEPTIKLTKVDIINVLSTIIKDKSS